MIKNAAVALVAVLALAGCGNRIVKLTEAGDGRWKVGTNGELRTGTWRAANTGPHPEGLECVWTVTKEAHEGTVDLRSSDTDSKVQEVFLADGDIAEWHNCGTWAWVTKDNIT